MSGTRKAPDEPEKNAETGDNSSRRSTMGLKAIAATTERLVVKSAGKQGFADAALIANWESIVGSAIGATTVPLRITFPTGSRTGGTLVVRVGSGPFATELQHLEPQVLERINGHFGYGAVARLALVQGPVPPRRKPKSKPPAPPPEAEQALNQAVSAVEDDGLRDALLRLGRQLASGQS